MIWFKIKSLENLLIKGKVSDKIVFNYLLAHLIFLIVVGYLGEKDYATWALWIHFFINLGLIIWGVRRTFQINQEGDNRDYFKRFISLSFVANIRMIVISFIIIFPLIAVALTMDMFEMYSFENSNVKEAFTLLIYLGLNLIYYNMLLRSFKRVNAAGAAPGQVGVV